MNTVTRRFYFRAFHLLGHLPAGHPCRGFHPHNYTVEVRFQSTDPVLIADYRVLRDFESLLRTGFESRSLNNLYTFTPTAENLAFHFFTALAPFFDGRLLAVRVSQDGLNWAENLHPMPTPGFIEDLTDRRVA